MAEEGERPPEKLARENGRERETGSSRRESEGEGERERPRWEPHGKPLFGASVFFSFLFFFLLG